MVISLIKNDIKVRHLDGVNEDLGLKLALITGFRLFKEIYRFSTLEFPNFHQNTKLFKLIRVKFWAESKKSMRGLITRTLGLTESTLLTRNWQFISLYVSFSSPSILQGYALIILLNIYKWITNSPSFCPSTWSASWWFVGWYLNGLLTVSSEILYWARISLFWLVFHI